MENYRIKKIMLDGPFVANELLKYRFESIVLPRADVVTTTWICSDSTGSYEFINTDKLFRKSREDMMDHKFHLSDEKVLKDSIRVKSFEKIVAVRSMYVMAIVWWLILLVLIWDFIPISKLCFVPRVAKLHRHRMLEPSLRCNT